MVTVDTCKDVIRAFVSQYSHITVDILEETDEAIMLGMSSSLAGVRTGVTFDISKSLYTKEDINLTLMTEMRVLKIHKRMHVLLLSLSPTLIGKIQSYTYAPDGQETEVRDYHTIWLTMCLERLGVVAYKEYPNQVLRVKVVDSMAWHILCQMKEQW